MRDDVGEDAVEVDRGLPADRGCDLFDRRLAVERVFDPDLVDLVVRNEDELGLGLASARMRSARSTILIRPVEPTLKISPEIDRSSISPFSARIVSETWQNERVCVPSPWISSGPPESACCTKRGITIPYWPLWRGPTVLKRRAMTQSRPRSCL